MRKRKMLSFINIKIIKYIYLITSLKSLLTLWLQLSYTLQKAKFQRKQKAQWFPGARKQRRLIENREFLGKQNNSL